jgi:hypothetical protein
MQGVLAAGQGEVVRDGSLILSRGSAAYRPRAK